MQTEATSIGYAQLQRVKTRRALWGFIMLTLAAYLLRFGYSSGFSDQDEILPLVLRLQDSSLFAQDWFVLLQADSFGVRTVFIHFIRVLSRLMPLSIVLLLLQFATFSAIGAAIFRLSMALHRNRLAAGLSVLLSMVITARLNPGGNDIIHAMIVPSSVAWAFSLWSLERALRRRFVWAGFLLAAALLAQPLVGLQLGAIMILALFLTANFTGASLLRLALPFVAVALPMVILFADMGIDPSVGAVDFSASQILTHIRAPHHYLPEMFDARQVISFALLFILGYATLWRGAIPVPDWLRNKPNGLYLSGSTRGVFLALGLAGVGVLFLAFVFSWAWPVSSIVRLQPFNVSVLLRVIAVIAISVLALAFVPASFETRLQRMICSDAFLPFSFLVLVLALFLRIDVAAIQTGMHPGDESSTELFEWVQDNTQQDAIFAIPPSFSGFQFGARRAQYVSFKSFPYESAASREWLRRLQLVAFVPDLEPGGVALQERMDAAFFAVSALDWSRILGSEDIDFILRPAHLKGSFMGVEPAWCSPEWCVYWAGRILLDQNSRP